MSTRNTNTLLRMLIVAILIMFVAALAFRDQTLTRGVIIMVTAIMGTAMITTLRFDP